MCFRVCDYVEKVCPVLESLSKFGFQKFVKSDRLGLESFEIWFCDLIKLTL